MQTELYVGVAARRDGFEVAAFAPDGALMSTRFPGGTLGVAGMRLFLATYGSSARLAIAGKGAAGLALSLENASGAATFIVFPPTSGSDAEALARYARRTH